jgi:hypothetical protein
MEQQPFTFPDCPRCQGRSVPLSPVKRPGQDYSVYGCKACGLTFTADGKAYVEKTEELKDIFSGATGAHKVILEGLAKERLNPATRTLLSARIMEYGSDMWFEGLKQGLLLGATSEQELENRARDVIEEHYTSRGTAALTRLEEFLNGHGKTQR